MRNLLFIVCIAAFASCTGNQAKPESQPEDKNRLSTDLVNNPRSAEGANPVGMSALPTMDFTDTFYNFQSIKEGEVVTHDFDFTNHGKSPLIVTNAKGSCGCTIADYPHEPVPPGKTGVISVKFNSEHKGGHQEKSVTVSTNSNRGMHMLNIQAEVQSK